MSEQSFSYLKSAATIGGECNRTGNIGCDDPNSANDTVHLSPTTQKIPSIIATDSTLNSNIAATSMTSVRTMTTTNSQTPTIAITETSDITTTIVSSAKRAKKANKVDFVRFDSSETIFSPSISDQQEDSIIRAKIKDEIKKLV